MKIIALALLASALVGQPIDSMVHIGTLVVSSKATEICSQRADERFIRIVPGQEKACWLQVVKSHNENMNDPKSHAMVDAFMEQLARQLGKRLIACEKESR